MPIFHYKTIDGNGIRSDGEVEVPNKKELEVYLNNRGLYLESFERDHSQLPFMNKKVKLRDIIIFSRQFAIMISAGIPIGDAMKTISTFTTNRQFTSTLKEIEGDLSIGIPMSESMAKHDDIFKFFFISMMRVGEFSGELDTVLKKVADYYEDEGRLLKKLRSALAYPIVLVLMLIGLVGFLMVKLVPMYEQMFANMNIKLPTITQGLIDVSHFFQSFYLIILAVIILTGFLLYRYYKTESGRYNMDKLILQLPIVGEVYQKTTTARFARSMNILLNSGITIVQSFEILDHLIANKVLQERFLQCKDSVNLGYSYYASLDKMNFFPPILVNMVAVGEKTGSLGEVFDKTSLFFQDEADTSIDRAIALIEPIMMILVAIVILVVFLAVMLPMFDILNNTTK